MNIELQAYEKHAALVNDSGGMKKKRKEGRKKEGK